MRHAYSVNNFVHRLTKHTSCVGKKNASHLTKSARPCRLSFEVFFFVFFLRLYVTTWAAHDTAAAQVMQHHRVNSRFSVVFHLFLRVFEDGHRRFRVDLLRVFTNSLSLSRYAPNKYTVKKPAYNGKKIHISRFCIFLTRLGEVDDAL